MAGGTYAQQAPAPRPYRITTTTAALFAQAQARPAPASIVSDKQGFTRSGETFTLRLTKGRRLRLVSKPTAAFEEESAELTYVGKLAHLPKYVLHVLYYEGSAYLLVDETTGVIDTLQGPPVPSPKRGAVAALYQGYPFEGALNGVEVFQVAAPHLRRKFSIAQGKWVPYELAWVDERNFLIKCLPVAVEEAIDRGKLPEKTRQNSQKFTYLRVTMR
ncbi:hypothetical protein I2I05_18805 [Hymenobacter sp. BT683]|uniref:Uncharacterized protein n=1 Tax=Hymenobacter jeongseonensis TaxID=2791027 RepID=A0ABS0INU7_9BACT|nr:hypothetical protein [Hymenobacter jeongseonensis]MBF9239450.1 hypothetical protein [Hymenobacter jeongseonensis]